MLNEIGLTINIDDIIVPLERQRADIGDTEQLSKTATKFMGQIQSLAVQKMPAGSAKPYRLIAGARRIAAFKAAGMEEVLVRVYSEDLSRMQCEEIELIENLARQDLTWQEEVNAVRRIHELMVSEHGLRDRNLSGNFEGWGFDQTAELIGVSRPKVMRAVKLSKSIEEVPELAEAKGIRDAEAALYKLEEQVVLRELALRAESKKGEHPSIEDCYQTANALEMFPTIADGSFDFIDLDPPYGIAFDGSSSFAARRDGREASHVASAKQFHDVSVLDFPAFYNSIIAHCYRILKPTGWIITWFGHDPWCKFVGDALANAGFRLNRIPAIWCKSMLPNAKQGSNPNPDHVLTNMYEMFYYARKDSSKITMSGKGRYDIFTYERFTSGRSHPTEKPVELMKDILLTFVLPGAKVLSPFAGSGNTLIAAHELGMESLGFDINPVYKGSFLVKIKQRTKE